MRTKTAAALIAAAWALSGAPAEANDSTADFYRAHPISLYVGFSAGSAYDVLGRAVAANLGRHIPGDPQVVTIDQPGAGGLTLLNNLYSAAKKDGTQIATFSRSLPLDPLVGEKAARYDPRKFVWLGSVAPETSLCVSWHTSAVKTWSDLLRRPFAAGVNSPSADTGVFVNLINNLFGAKIKLVIGYPGGPEISAAMERGEIDGRCGWSWSALKSTKPAWLKNRLVNLLVQVALQPNPELADVPLIMNEAKSERQRQVLRLILAPQAMAWPYAAPPGIPADRAAALRAGFAATMRDPAFLAQARRLKFDVDPASGEAIEALLRQMYQTRPAIVAQVRTLLNPN